MREIASRSLRNDAAIAVQPVFRSNRPMGLPTSFQTTEDPSLPLMHFAEHGAERLDTAAGAQLRRIETAIARLPEIVRVCG